MPWKNGKGTTTELAVGYAPGDASREGARFAWRLSLAELPETGPFSDFAGYERTILMVEGPVGGGGMTLDFGPHGRTVVDRPFEPVGFSGDWATHCRLHGGPIRDLNLMVARELARAEVEVLRLGGDAVERTATREGSGDLLLCYGLAGDAELTLDGGTPQRLARHETLLVQGDGANCPALSASIGDSGGEAVLFLAWISLRQS